jgi:hypothetical protein
MYISVYERDFEREREREREREEINSQQLEPQSQTEDLWLRMSLHLAWDWA